MDGGDFPDHWPGQSSRQWNGTHLHGRADVFVLYITNNTAVVNCRSITQTLLYLIGTLDSFPEAPLLPKSMIGSCLSAFMGSGPSTAYYSSARVGAHEHICRTKSGVRRSGEAQQGCRLESWLQLHVALPRRLAG